MGSLVAQQYQVQITCCPFCQLHGGGFESLSPVPLNKMCWRTLFEKLFQMLIKKNGFTKKIIRRMFVVVKETTAKIGLEKKIGYYCKRVKVESHMHMT